MISRKIILISALLVLLCTGWLDAQSIPFDEVLFQQITEDEKLAFVLAVLQNRESQLQNFAYQMTDRLSRYTPQDGKTAFLSEVSLGVKRLGKKLYLEAEKLDSKNRWQKFYANWDGNISKSLLHRPYRKDEYGGLIRDLENNNFQDRAYNHILGLRLLDTEHMTLPEWLEDADTQGKSIEISFIEQDGKPLIECTITRGFKSYQWFLDVNRDYMPVRAEILYKQGENYNSDSMMVDEALEVDGFWVPKKVLRTTGTSVSDGQGKYVYEVSEFTRNTVTDEDFEIEFPPGTKVVDTIANFAYRVLPGGAAEPLPLYDPVSGEVINPAVAITPDLDEIIKTDAPKKTTAQKEENIVKPIAKELMNPDSPQIDTKPPSIVAETSSARWLYFTAIGVGFIVVLLGLKLFVARRRRSG